MVWVCFFGSPGKLYLKKMAGQEGYADCRIVPGCCCKLYDINRSSDGSIRLVPVFYFEGNIAQL